MRYSEIAGLFETYGDDEAHGNALRRTGFWGSQGAGCVFFATETGRFLLGHRSDYVEQPGTWGTFGGAIDSGESPIEAIKREIHEEAGYNGAYRIRPLFMFTKGSFRYSNFLVIVATEFQATLNWENDEARWCKWGEWPQPLHFGLISLFNDPASSAVMQAMARKAFGMQIKEDWRGTLDDFDIIG